VPLQLDTGRAGEGTVPDSCLAVSPRKVAGDAAAAALMVAVIGDVQGERLQRREVRFDGVEPAGVGGVKTASMLCASKYCRTAGWQ
jgi:hypothetical protein